MIIACQNPDGKISITIPVSERANQDYVDEVVSKLRPGWRFLGVFKREELPDMAYRGAWRFDEKTKRIYEDPAIKAEKGWRLIRFNRDKLLAETDGLSVRNSELGKKDPNLSSYRQKLRDIPQDNKDPFNIVWPDKPNGV